MMADLFPNDELRYYDAFCKQWDYCKKYLIDREHGGWYWGVWISCRRTDTPQKDRSGRGTTIHLEH